MKHSDLCDAAVRWLYGTAGCNVALSGIASAREIPDAIGWSSGTRLHAGSIVVECKVSRADFYANKNKKHGNRMGNFRYFLVPDGLLPLASVWDNYAGSGLLYLRGSRIRIVAKATENFSADLASENRLLQFAVLHIKENLLYSGCAVDMNRLTKHPISNRRAAGWGFYGSRHLDLGLGIEFPSDPFQFNWGESK